MRIRICMSAEAGKFSGNVRLRMASTLHRDLAKKAKSEGVSLNQFACAALAVAVGWQGGPVEDDVSPSPSTGPGDEAFAKFWRDRLS
jgi:HicB family